MHEYLSHCYDCLFENGLKPECYIRLDRSHVVASIIRNKQIDKQFGKQKAPKTFYRRLIGFSIQQTDIELVEKMIRDMFTVVYNKNLSKSSKEIQKSMVSTTKTHKIDEENQLESTRDERIPDSKFHEKTSKFYQWVESIANDEKIKAKSLPLNNSDASLDDSIDSNMYYAPGIAKTLIEIFSKLPLNSFIMDKSFGQKMEIATSSATEAGFRVMKRNVFAGAGRIRVDAWLERHLKYLLGKTLNEKSNIDVIDNDFKDYDDDCKTDLIIESDSENEYETDGNDHAEVMTENDFDDNEIENVVETCDDQLIETNQSKKCSPRKCASEHDKKEVETNVMIKSDESEKVVETWVDQLIEIDETKNGKPLGKSAGRHDKKEVGKGSKENVTKTKEKNTMHSITV